MSQAFARVRGTEDWRPVTWSGRQYKAPTEVLEGLLVAMRSAFPNLEYRIVDDL